MYVRYIHQIFTSVSLSKKENRKKGIYQSLFITVLW